MRIPGPRQSILGLFGGPGFLFALLLVAALAGGIAYLATTGYPTLGGGAGLTLPGTGAAPMSATPPQSGDSAGLASMPAIPTPKEIPIRVAIDEDLSPAILLAKYPPPAGDALAPGAVDLPAWKRFGRPSAVSSDARRLALVITGLGRDRNATIRIITGTPPEVSLSFGADVADLADWIVAARAFGHEALLDVALGTQDHPVADGLVREFGPERNLPQLDAILERAPMIAGVAISGADTFLGDARALQPIIDRLHERGLATIGLSITAPLTLGADEAITAGSAPAAIDQAMTSAQSLAHRRGAALATISAPESLHLLTEWYRAVAERAEISLVPASALVGD